MRPIAACAARARPTGLTWRSFARETRGRGTASILIRLIRLRFKGGMQGVRPVRRRASREARRWAGCTGCALARRVVRRDRRGSVCRLEDPSVRLVLYIARRVWREVSGG